MNTQATRQDGAEAPTRSRLSIKGSSKIVSEFFEYSINSILYQRGIYPPDDFQIVKKYGLNLLVSVDGEVKAYIRRIMSQLHKWVVGGQISRLVVVITERDTAEVVERWQFDVEVFPELLQAEGKENRIDSVEKCDTGKSEKQKNQDKSLADIQAEIRTIIRQITASVTFLPELQGGHLAYTFNVLVYADKDANVPSEWIDSDPKEIEGGISEHVKLRSFSTNNHKVDTLVSYRLNEN